MPELGLTELGDLNTPSGLEYHFDNPKAVTVEIGIGIKKYLPNQKNKIY